MPTTIENWNPGKAVDRHPEATYEEKEKLFLEVKMIRATKTSCMDATSAAFAFQPALRRVSMILVRG